MRKGFLVVALALAGLGCDHAQTQPNKALDLYGKRLRDHDFNAAYEMMSSSFKAKVSREEFVRMMQDSPGEVNDTARRLDKKPSHTEVSAEFDYGLGDTMRLVHEGGGWKIASNPLAFYDQSTPRDALRSFIRAYRLQRWDVMLRFVPDKYRDKMDVAKMKEQFEGANKEQMEVLMNMLEANVAEPIDVKGTEARMSYGERYEVKFEREDGAWKIKDLD